MGNGIDGNSSCLHGGVGWSMSKPNPKTARERQRKDNGYKYFNRMLDTLFRRGRERKEQQAVN